MAQVMVVVVRVVLVAVLQVLAEHYLEALEIRHLQRLHKETTVAGHLVLERLFILQAVAVALVRQEHRQLLPAHPVTVVTAPAQTQLLAQHMLVVVVVDLLLRELRELLELEVPEHQVILP